MAITHKQSPAQFARSFVRQQLPNAQLDGTGALAIEPDELRALIGAAVIAFNDPSNQRPENLAEACARLGINLHWTQIGIGPREYRLYFGHKTPLSVHTHEEPLILELEELRARYPEVSVWVEAML